MTPIPDVDSQQVEDPVELVEMIKDIYRRLAAVEVAIKMTRHSEAR